MDRISRDTHLLFQELLYKIFSHERRLRARRIVFLLHPPETMTGIPVCVRFSSTTTNTYKYRQLCCCCSAFCLSVCVYVCVCEVGSRGFRDVSCVFGSGSSWPPPLSFRRRARVWGIPCMRATFFDDNDERLFFFVSGYTSSSAYYVSDASRCTEARAYLR